MRGDAAIIPLLNLVKGILLFLMLPLIGLDEERVQKMERAELPPLPEGADAPASCKERAETLLPDVRVRLRSISET